MSIDRNSPTGERAVKRVADMARAFELRTRRMSMRAIAAELGCSLTKVHELLTDGVKEHPVENIDLHRQMANASLDESEGRALRIIAAHSAAAESGDVESAGVIHNVEADLAKIRAERNKVNGIYAPIRTELTGAAGGPLVGVTVTPAEARKVMSELFPGSVGPLADTPDDGSAPPGATAV